jgi:hypothetical protein
MPDTLRAATDNFAHTFENEARSQANRSMNLGERTAPLIGPGWPDEGATFPVRECLIVVLDEEWQHRMYAERDLAVLEAAA